MLKAIPFLAALLLAAPAFGDTCTLDGVLPHPRHQIPVSPNHLFGSALDAERHVVAVGIPDHEDMGAVGMFRRIPAGWTLDSFLMPAGLAVDDDFGEAVSLHRGVLAVGASGSQMHGLDSGAVYVFRYDSTAHEWVLEDTPHEPGTVGAGVDVSVHGDTLAVGASSQVVIFRLINGSWQHEQTIDEFDEDAFSFGDGVAVHEDVLVVADDRYAGPGFSKAGRAYTFHRTGTTWTLASTIMPPSMTLSPIHFGEYVDIHGDWAIISAHLNDSATTQPGGKAHLYRLAADGTVAEHQPLAPVPGQVGDQFSKGVAIRGSQALVGAPGEDGSEGAVYLYELVDGTWTEIHREPQPPGYFMSPAEFGTAVAIGGYFAVGAPRPGTLDRTGRVFVVETPCEP